MSTYELPDGFQGMETAPKNTTVNVVAASGKYDTDHYPFFPYIIGWSPIVPPKKKRRFVVKPSKFYRGRWIVSDIKDNQCVADIIPTETQAQAVADIYEQAYEGGV